MLKLINKFSTLYSTYKYILDFLDNMLRLSFLLFYLLAFSIFCILPSFWLEEKCENDN